MATYYTESILAAVATVMSPATSRYLSFEMNGLAGARNPVFGGDPSDMRDCGRATAYCEDDPTGGSAREGPFQLATLRPIILAAR